METIRIKTADKVSCEQAKDGNMKAAKPEVAVKLTHSLTHSLTHRKQMRTKPGRSKVSTTEAAIGPGRCMISERKPRLKMV
jgi:hypothetical protein